MAVVVDTTAQAEMDFAMNYITEAQQELIAKNLKNTPRSARDRFIGDIRIREVIQGYDVAFVVAFDGSDWVMLIVGLEKCGEMESLMDILRRAAFASLHPSVQELLEGRKEKR